MDQTSLLHILEWISNHDGEPFDGHRITTDTGIDIPSTFTSVLSVIDHILHQAVSNAADSIGNDSPANSDDLFDLILTFFENLNAYHPSFVRIYHNLSSVTALYTYAPLVHSVTARLLAAYIHTHLDHLTYNAIFIKLCHTWLNDTPPNLPCTSDAINRFVHALDI